MTTRIHCDGCDTTIDQEKYSSKKWVKASLMIADVKKRRDLCPTCAARFMDIADPVNWPRKRNIDRGAP